MAYRTCAACGSILESGEKCSCGSRDIRYINQIRPERSAKTDKANKRTYYEDMVKAARERYLAETY